MTQPPPKRLPAGLQARAAVLCLGVAVLGVVPSSLFLLSQQKEEGFRSLKSRAATAAESIAAAAEAPLTIRASLLESTATRMLVEPGMVDYILATPAKNGRSRLYLAGGTVKTLDPTGGPAENTERKQEERVSTYSGKQVLCTTLPLSSGGRVEVAITMEHFTAALAAAQRRTVYAGGVAVIAGLLCSFLFARRVTRPLGQLCEMAQDIAGGDLARRSPKTGGPREISTLAENLNTMAARLEEDRVQQQSSQEELRQVNAELQLRGRRKQMLADISGEFLKTEPTATDALFIATLGRVAEEFGVEGACIFTRSPANPGVLHKTWEWNCLSGPICGMERVPEAGFPWAIAHVAKHGVLTIPESCALPQEARAERINLERLGITTAAGAALGAGEKPTAYLFLRGHRGARAWGEVDEQFLALAAGIFTNAINRREAFAEREQLQSQLLQSQKMEAVGQLSGGIAHDFNNMLVPIIGYSDSILSQSPGDAPWAGEIREIKRAAESAASITRRLLTFSRQQITTKKEMDLNAHIESVHKMLSRLLGETIRLDLELAPDLWSISADCSQVDQCLVNLTVNAKAAMPALGGAIRICTTMVDSEDSRFTPQPGKKAQGLFVRLSVQDTGTGMDEATLARIFEPFFSTKGQDGTGLGLSVVHGVVIDHGGWITVDSKPGSGTTFHLWLPALNEPLPKAMDTGMATATKIPRGEGQTILLIEDEPGVLAFVSAALRQNGYKMLTATNGAAAREIFRERCDSIDLVMSDVVLPDASGVELVEEFYTLAPGLRALLSSGYNDKQSLVELVEKRGLRFLHKPYTLLQLLESVHSAVHGTGQRVEVM